MKLTKESIATLALSNGKRDQFFWDDELPRFARRLRIGADGKVAGTWVIQWKVGRTTKRMRLGTDVLDPKPARAMAKKLLGRIEQGEDPSSDKKKRREQDERTMGKLVDSYLADKGDEWAAKTTLDITRYLTDVRYAGPLLRMPVDSIGLKDIALRIDVIKKEMGSATAANWRSAVSAFFVWCLRRGLCGQNPVIDSETPVITARERVLSGEEIVKVWRACADDDHGKIVKLLVLLAARRQEIGGMRHEEFSDLDGPSPTWTLPASRSKNGRALTLPLMPMALGIIRSVPVMAYRPQLFGQRASAGFSGWSRAKEALDARCGVEGFTLHDLRRSTASGLGDIGVQPHIIEEILNHKPPGIRGVYNKSPYAREVRAALTLWEDHLRALIDGGERKVLSFGMKSVS
jgi:integrase